MTVKGNYLLLLIDQYILLPKSMCVIAYLQFILTTFYVNMDLVSCTCLGPHDEGHSVLCIMESII